MKLSKKMLLCGAMLIFFVLLTVSCGDEESPVAPAIDYRPPLIEWIAPASGADLVGVTRLAFTILDDASGIDRFAVYRNGFAPDDWRMSASDDSVYFIDWDTQDVPDGFYFLEVRAYDDAGNMGISPALRVNVRNNQDPREDHTPPDLWWTAPVPGSTLSGETVLQIKFYDESGVDSVRLLKNGAVVTTLFCAGEQDGQDGQDLACRHTPSCDSNSNDLSGRRGRLPAHSLDGDSLTYLWDTSADPDGVYVWEARAFDAAGNMGLSPSLLVKVRNSQDPPPDDRMPPVMSWISPQPNSEIAGSTELLFQVLDNVGVDSVRIYLNGSSPVEFKLDGHDEIDYALNWDTAVDPDGVYVLELRAWDTSSNMGSGTALVVHVLNNPTEPADQIEPDVYWTAPDAGSTLQDTVSLQFRVLDEGVIDYIRLYKNGSTSDEYRIPGNETGEYDFLWDTRTDSDGVYVWEARAWDEAGNMGFSTALLVRVWNNEEPPWDDRTPPVITWLSPDPGDTLLGAVHLRFQVMDNSPLDSVQVFLNGQKWQNLYYMENFYDGDVIWITSNWGDGNYIIQIKAYDTYGNIGLGEVVWFAVWNNRPRVIWVPDDYGTIQDAVNSSVDGDTIRVRPGIYPENVRLMGKSIWLESERGPEFTTIDGTGWAYAIIATDNETLNTVVRGFTIIISWCGICVYSPSEIVVYNCIIIGEEDAEWSVMGVNVEDSNTHIYNCIFDTNVRCIDVLYSWGLIRNSIFVNSTNAIYWRALLRHGFDYGWSLFWNNETDYWSQIEIDYQESDVIANPRFIEDTYQLSLDSPAINAGDPGIVDIDGSRSDIGVYGGPYAYTIQ